MTNNNSNNIENKLQEFLQNNASTIIISFLLFIFILFISKKIAMKKQNCNRIREDTGTYDFYTFNDLRQMNYFKSGESNNYTCRLKDYFIKSAHNCFCTGSFKNDYVENCALQKCQRHGVRFLDMQIFSLNKQPIIAANSDNNNHYKETYNHIDFDDGIEQINRMFIRDDDFPLFLHLRIHYDSKQTDLNKNNNKMKTRFYNKIYDTIIDKIENTKLFTKNQRMFYTNYDKVRESIIPNLEIDQTQGKVFIFVTLNNHHPDIDNFKRSKLNEITDLVSNDQGIELSRSGELINDNYMSYEGLSKLKLVMCLPEISIKSNNYDFTNAMSNGLQFIAMNYQNSDQNLNYYDNFFIEQIGSSSQNMTSPIIKKPDHMINTRGSSNSFFIPQMTYELMTTDTSYCRDISNETDVIKCDQDEPDNNYQLFNIYQSNDNNSQYYFKSAIRQKYCDLSDENLICDSDVPTKTSYLNFTRTGLDEYTIADASNNYICYGTEDNIYCNSENRALNSPAKFTIRKRLL